MASYATIADLSKAEGSETKVAQLGYDGTGTVSVDDAGTAAVLNRAIEDASNEVRGALIGRVDFTDAQVLADCRRYAVILALYALHIRRGHYGPANPYNDSARAVRSELKAIRAGAHNTGTAATPAGLAVSITPIDDVTPVFNRDSDGDEPSIMRNW